MKQEIIEKFEELLKNEQISEIKDEAKNLIQQYHHARQEQTQNEKNAFLANGGNPHYFEPEKDPLDGRFKELQNIYTDRYEKFKDERFALENENLAQKLDLIAELNDIIENEENIGRAFFRFSAVRKKWNEIGHVPEKKRADIAHDFSNLTERFYYNIKIFKELKDNDLKKNFELKSEVVNRVKELVKLKSIKETQLLLDAYQVEWDQIGPTPQEDWPKLKEDYFAAINDVNHKIREHFKNLKEHHKENLDKKLEIIEQLKQLTQQLPDKANDWNVLSEKVHHIQDNYRKVGQGPHKQNENAWEEFKALLDKFYEARKAFYETRTEALASIKSNKLEIIEKAKSLVPNDVNPERVNWKQLTEQLIKLQHDWKNTGTLLQRDERKIWENFRKVCNKFFELKKEFHASLKDRYSENTQKKLELINKIESFKKSDNIQADEELLKDLTLQFQTLGPVAEKDKNRINSQFSKASKKAFDAIGISKNEMGQVLFENKIEIIKTEAQSPKHQLNSELRHAKEKIKTLEAELLQYENNLGFFKYTKDDNPMKREVMQKIEKIGEQITEWKEKQKTIQKTLRDLEKPKTEQVENQESKSK